MRRLIAVFLAMVLLTGCQLAEEQKRETTMDDKLVGVFVTFEHLDLGFDIEGYIRDNGGISDGEVIQAGSEYANRLYAKIGESGWEFPGYDGLIMGQMWLEDHWHGFSTEGFCGIDTHVTGSGTSDGIEETGTVYVPMGTAVMLCANPVYMTPEGQYYVVQGNSFHSSVDCGSMSQSVSDEKTWTADGVEYSYCARFTTVVQGVELAERVVLIQMSGDHKELGRAEYVPGQMPETIEPAEGAAYVIVEEYNSNGVRRTLNQPGDEHITVYYQEDQVYCLPQVTEVLWEE